MEEEKPGQFVAELIMRVRLNTSSTVVKDAIIDYDTALGINPNQASSLYGRGLAKRRKGDSAGGDRDIDAAKDIQSDIVDEFFWYAVR
jgi:hypothetical protein